MGTCASVWAVRAAAEQAGAVEAEGKLMGQVSLLQALLVGYQDQ
jgi:hypothetical protein